MAMEPRPLARKAFRVGWGLLLLLDCSRSALQDPERKSNELSHRGGGDVREGAGGSLRQTGNGAGVVGGNTTTGYDASGGAVEIGSNNGGVAGGFGGSPTTVSRRWIAILAQGPNGKMQAHGMRFGQNDIEDYVRLDPVKGGFDRVFGKFSPLGRGYALRVEEQSIYRAERLIDFNDSKLISGYGAEFGQSSIDWLDFSDPSKPPSSHQLLCDGGVPMFLGRLTEDGRNRYGICGSATGSTLPLQAPVVLARYDFTPTLLGPIQLSRLTERANVTNYEFAPDNSALVYSALPNVDGGAVNDDYSSELGTFWVSVAGGLPKRLALAWRDDWMTWLPNAEGLLRVGWQNSSVNPTDVIWAERFDPNDWDTSARRTMHWLRFDGSIGYVSMEAPASPRT